MIERQGGQRILQSTPATLRVLFEQDGNATEPGTVTVTITRLDGTALVSGATTVVGDTGERTYALTAAQTANLDYLTAVWASDTLGTVTTTAEIVGNHLFTISEARSFDNAAMADAAAYPQSAIAEARRRIEDAFEEICGISFIPRINREVMSGDGSDLLILPMQQVTEVVSIETRSGSTWTAFSTEDLGYVLVEDWGALIRENGTWPAGRRNVRVTYIHGYERVPLEIKREGLVLLRGSAVNSNIDPRAMSYSDGVGTIRFVTPGLSRGAWFDIPSVNAALQRYERNVPAIG